MWPDSVTDFYPHNMLTLARSNPWLTRLPRAVKEVRRGADPTPPLSLPALNTIVASKTIEASLLNVIRQLMIEPGERQQELGSAFQFDPTATEGRYLHLQLTPK